MRKIVLSLAILFFCCLAQGLAQRSLVNLGGNVNSSLSEISPLISPDGKTLYFSRSVPGRHNTQNRNIRYAKRRGNGYFSPSRPLEGELNNDGWNVVSGFTSDGKTMLLAGVYMPDGTLKGGFSISHSTENGWTVPVPLRIKDLSREYSTQAATMSPDGKVIIFSSNSVMGNEFYGMFDLYITFRQENGEWTSPKNIGKAVNTDAYETAPFLAADGVSLYFSSTREGGYGGADIYLTRRLDSTWTNWSEPENLGSAVNSRHWESYISVTASARYAYIGSTARSYGKMDIFKVRLKDELKPLNDTLLKVLPKIKAPERKIAEHKEVKGKKQEKKVSEQKEKNKPEKLAEEKNQEQPLRLVYDEFKAGKLENLGETVNSYLSEMAPLISPDGNTLYFSRSVAYDWKNKNRNIFCSRLLPDSTWSRAKTVSPRLNNKGWNLMCGITPDGNTMLLSGVYKQDGTLDGGFSKSYRTSTGEWSSPFPLKIKNLPKTEEIQSATMSPDGKVIVFSSYHDLCGEFYGTMDLYATIEQSDGRWCAPFNLGKVINTKDYETSPFLAADGITLYFSTNGHGGYGSQDIYATKRLDNSWRKWSEPQNLGAEVNSPGWEAYFSIPASGRYAYVGSRKENTLGRMDLFRIYLEETTKPTPVVIVRGKVLNSETNEPLLADISYSLLGDTLTAGKARTNPETGEYKIVLNSGGMYGFHAQAKGFFGVNENMDLTTLENYKEVEKDLLLTPFDTEKAFLLKNVFFDRGKWDLKPESFAELDRLLKLLEENPEMKIEIGGHTEWGHKDKTLSQQRADSVRNYLIGKGISPGRVRAIGYGNTKPVNDNQTVEDRAKNRRVEFKIIE